MNHATFPNYKVYETKLGGRTLTVELGKMAGLANGSCLVKYGDTSVLATAVMADKPRDGLISSRSTSIMKSGFIP